MSEEESEESKKGRQFNDDRKIEQEKRNKASDKKGVEEYELDAVRDANKPNNPSEKGGSKRRRRRSRKRRRRSSKKRCRTMRK
jgi:hypothetical protein